MKKRKRDAEKLIRTDWTRVFDGGVGFSDKWKEKTTEKRREREQRTECHLQYFLRRLFFFEKYSHEWELIITIDDVAIHLFHFRDAFDFLHSLFPSIPLCLSAFLSRTRHLVYAFFSFLFFFLFVFFLVPFIRSRFEYYMYIWWNNIRIHLNF